MKKFCLILQTVVVSMTFANCDFYDDRLKISNFTNNDLYIRAGADSTLMMRPNKTFALPDALVKAKSTKNMSIRGKNAWEKVADANDRLHIFAISSDTLHKFGSTEVMKKKLYNRKDISIRELKANNWSVIFK